MKKNIGDRDEVRRGDACSREGIENQSAKTTAAEKARPLRQRGSDPFCAPPLAVGGNKPIGKSHRFIKLSPVERGKDQAAVKFLTMAAFGGITGIWIFGSIDAQLSKHQDPEEYMKQLSGSFRQEQRHQAKPEVLLRQGHNDMMKKMPIMA